jgi:hypothetical protein
VRQRDSRRGLSCMDAVERCAEVRHGEPEQDAQERQHDDEFDERVSPALHTP